MMRFYKKIPAGGVGGPQRRWRRRSRPTRYPKQPQNVAKSFLFTHPAALPRPSARQFGAPADRIFCFKPPLSPEAEGVESRKFGNKKREKRSSQNVSLSIFTLPLPLFRGQNGCHRGQNGVSRDNDCHPFSPLSVADALVVRGDIPLFSPRRVKTRRA